MYKSTKKMEVALEMLMQMHQRISDKVNLSNKNIKLAIYVLTGRILTNCHAAILLMRYGFIGEAGILLRSIFESMHVAEYFYTKRNYKDLTNWFNDESIRPKTARKVMSTLFERILGKKDIAFEQMVNKLYGGFSKYVHPTFNISKINMIKKTSKFDYNCSIARNAYTQYPFSVAQCIASIVHTFIRMYDIFEIDKDELMELTYQAQILSNEANA
jgi:hypothetical protein